MNCRIVIVALMAVIPALRSSAQSLPVALASQVQADLVTLSSHPTLAEWRKIHPGGKLNLVDKSFDPGDAALFDTWCASSVSQGPAEVTRVAHFYSPPVQRTTLLPLPREGAPAAAGSCLLYAISWQTRANVSIAALTRALSSWGAPNGETTPSAMAWQREGVNIRIVAFSRTAREDDDGPRLAIVVTPAGKDDVRSPDDAVGLLDERIRRQIADAAAQLAKRTAALTTAVLIGAHCDSTRGFRGAEPLPADPIVQWLKQSAGLPSERRAASLLLADIYIKCADSPGPVAEGIVALGVRSVTHCVQDGPVYSHNFRDEAEKLALDGRVAELAGVASFTEPCSLKGRRPWQDLVIERGNRLLSRFPPDRWTPWIHYAVARAYASILTERDVETGDPALLTPVARQRERVAAINHFREFISQNPDAPESVFALHEAWRILAGLKPDGTGFGCGCE